jgi:hypothetical protein
MLLCSVSWRWYCTARKRVWLAVIPTRALAPLPRYLRMRNTFRAMLHSLDPRGLPQGVLSVRTMSSSSPSSPGRGRWLSQGLNFVAPLSQVPWSLPLYRTRSPTSFDPIVRLLLARSISSFLFCASNTKSRFNSAIECSCCDGAQHERFSYALATPVPFALSLAKGA